MYSTKPGSSFTQRPAFEDVDLPDEPVLDGDGNAVPTEQRTSTSTTRSRRDKFFAKRNSQQKSRPVSGATIRTSRSRSKGKRNSQYDAGVYPTHEEKSTAFQGERTEPGVRNFSKPQHSRASSAAREDQPNVSAMPPLPNPQRFSTATTAAQTKPNTQDGPKDGKSQPDRPPQETAPSQRQNKTVAELYTVSYLIFFSIFGTLARLGTQWIAFYPGAPVTFPVVWANMAGSFVMGFLSEDQRIFGHGFANMDKNDKRDDDEFDPPPVDVSQLTKYKKTIPLYVGLATGFCGSFTSFSSFTRDVFLALSNNLPAPTNHPSGSYNLPTTTLGRNGGYSFEALMAVILSTIALSIGGLIVGAHVASSLRKWIPTIPATFLCNILDPSMVVLAWGCWLGAVLLAIFPPQRMWRGEVLFALVFAPLGTLIRFYASAKLNGLVIAFPLGTFAVNMFGTAVEGMCYDIQHVGVGIMGQTGGGRVGCQILQGVMDGFCGCLTTVSTWVAEIRTLKRKHAYAYALASILGGLSLMVIIMGSVRWSVGFSEPICSTGYPSKGSA